MRKRTRVTAKVGSKTLTTTTGYDAAGRPTTVTDPLGRAFALSYDGDGGRTRVQSPNGTETTYAYDARHRVTRMGTVQTSTSTAIDSFAYELDAEGERTQVTEADATVRQCGYDAVSRLTSESVTGSLSYAKSFSYDAVGNRLSQTTTGQGDVLVGLREPADGVAMTGGAAVAHVYDADGNRMQTRVTPSGGSAATTNMLVDTAGGLSQVIAETDGSGAVTAVYVRAGDELLEVIGAPRQATTTPPAPYLGWNRTRLIFSIRL